MSQPRTAKASATANTGISFLLKFELLDDMALVLLMAATAADACCRLFRTKVPNEALAATRKHAPNHSTRKQG